MNNKTRFETRALLVGMWAVPLVAQAQMLAGPNVAFAAGVAHPFLGPDHLLAMIAIGMWSAQIGGRALWAVPLAFVATFTAALFTGHVGVPAGPMEAGVAASVFALGLLIATAARLPTAVGIALVSAFAVFHGHLHGVELLGARNPVSYGAGFVVATATLHVIGIVLGRALRNTHLLRGLGVALAFAGAALWLT